MKAIGTLQIKAVRLKDHTVEVRVFVRAGELVIHEPIYIAHDRAKGITTGIKSDDEYVIAHERSTFKIATLKLPQAKKAIAQLAELDWTSIPSEVEEVLKTVKPDHPIAAKVNAILAGIR